MADRVLIHLGMNKVKMPRSGFEPPTCRCCAGAVRAELFSPLLAVPTFQINLFRGATKFVKSKKLPL